MADRYIAGAAGIRVVCPVYVHETLVSFEFRGGYVDVDSVGTPKDGVSASNGQNGLFGSPTPAVPYGDGF
jgi:hypothetical protein